MQHEQQEKELLAAFRIVTEKDKAMILALTKQCANDEKAAPVRAIINFSEEG